MFQIKFQARSIVGVFLGYSSTQNGYKVLNLQIREFLVTRDIIFHEEIFPFNLERELNGSDHDQIFPFGNNDEDEGDPLYISPVVRTKHDRKGLDVTS